MSSSQKSKSARYIYASFAAENKDIAIPVIEHLIKCGYDVRYSDESADSGMQKLYASGCMISFITNEYVASERCRSELGEAQDVGLPLLDVYLTDVELSDGMVMQLGLNQALFRNRFKSHGAFLAALAELKILAPYRKGGVEKKQTSAKKASAGGYLPTRKKRRRRRPRVDLTPVTKKLPPLLMLSYAALGPLTVHLVTRNYPGFWLLLLYTALPLIALTVLGLIIAKSLADVSLTNDATTDMLGYGLGGVALALLATPFFVHTTSVVILKILISIGLNVIPTAVSFLILAISES